jgi:hypothetical protein
MTDNTKPLFAGQVHPNQADPDVVALLEDMLSRAKSGELRTAAFAGATNDGCTITAFCGRDHMFSTLGGISYLRKRAEDLIEAHGNG